MSVEEVRRSPAAQAIVQPLLVARERAGEIALRTKNIARPVEGDGQVAVVSPAPRRRVGRPEGLECLRRVVEDRGDVAQRDVRPGIVGVEAHHLPQHCGSFGVIVAEPQDVGLFLEYRGAPAERRLEGVLGHEGIPDRERAVRVEPAELLAGFRARCVEVRPGLRGRRRRVGLGAQRVDGLAQLVGDFVHGHVGEPEVLQDRPQALAVDALLLRDLANELPLLRREQRRPRASASPPSTNAAASSVRAAGLAPGNFGASLGGPGVSKKPISAVRAASWSRPTSDRRFRGVTEAGHLVTRLTSTGMKRPPIGSLQNAAVRSLLEYTGSM